MQMVRTVGLDIAKSVFQVHGVDGAGDRSTYENEKRAALDALSNYVMAAVAKSKGGNVERLRRA